MSTLGSHQNRALRYNSPASLKEWPESLVRCGLEAKAFDTVCVDGLVYKLTVVNFPSYLVRIITSYLCGWTFEGPFQTATSSRLGMRPEVVPQGRLISTVFFGLYIKDMPIPSRQGGVSSLRRQHGHHRHVPQASAACQPPGIICQRCRAVAERMEDYHKCL
jgi:hypothetical protein